MPNFNIFASVLYFTERLNRDWGYMRLIVVCDYG